MPGENKDTGSGKASPSVSQGSGKKSRNELVSRQSGKVTFPNSARSGDSSRRTAMSDDADPQRNPFTVPADNDIFMLRDKEREKAKQERLQQRQLKVHEKTTYASRINFKTTSMTHPVASDEEQEGGEDDDGRAVAVKEDPQFTLAVTRDRHVEKESLAEYITKKREMFLVQYSLGVKRDEMRKLEEVAAAEEHKLELAEQYLEEDAAMFDEFLKENDRNSVEAIKIAEAETKAKLEKVAEIKKINAQMMSIKSEISKYEDTLKEYQLYRRFLESLTPKEWIDERQPKRAQRREARLLARRARETATPTGSERSVDKVSSSRRLARNQPPSRSGTQSKDKDKTPLPPAESESNQMLTDSEDDSDEEPELYFTDPQQLLDLFAELEEQNLSLIQNSQETEEALEEMKQNIKKTRTKKKKVPTATLR